MLPYRRLEVWKRSHALAVALSRVADDAGAARHFWFRDQLLRAAWSVPLNIAEGNGRSTPLDYAAFLDRARGSLFEIDALLLAGFDLKPIDGESHTRLQQEVEEVCAMLLALVRRVRPMTHLKSRRPD